jgi:hypothetical protein
VWYAGLPDLAKARLQLGLVHAALRSNGTGSPF